MTAQANALVEANLGLASSAAQRAFSRFPTFADFDDFHQQARLGLMRAARYFDPSLGFKFSTLAYQLCWQNCMRYIGRDLHREAKGVRPRQMPVDEKGRQVPHPDHRPGPAALVEEAEEAAYRHKGLAAAMARLDARERKVLDLRARGDTLDQVGASIGGMSKERVRQIQNKALADVREMMGVPTSDAAL